MRYIKSFNESLFGFGKKKNLSNEIDCDFRGKINIIMYSNKHNTLIHKNKEEVINNFYNFGLNKTEIIGSIDSKNINNIKSKIDSILTKTKKVELSNKLDSILQIVEDYSGGIKFDTTYYKSGERPWKKYSALISLTINAECLKEIIKYLEL